MDSCKPTWWNWCRLCARKDCENNVHNIGLENRTADVKDSFQLSLEDMLKTKFNILLVGDILLPQKICSNCKTYLRSVMAFSERVAKVQKMYSFLLESNTSCDLREIRSEFDILDECIQPPDVVEVEGLENFAKSAIKDEVTIVEQQDEQPLDEYDVKPLNFGFPCSEEDPFDEVMDLNTQYFSSSTSEDEVNQRRQRKGVSRKNVSKETDSSFPWKQTNEHQKKCKQLVPNDHQLDEENPKTSDNGNYRCRSASEEEQENFEKIIKRKKNFQRDLNRKRKEEIPIDYSMEGFCTVCNERFVLFSKYCEHVLKSHVDNQWKCIPCNRKLQSRYEFEKHLRKHLPKNSIIKHICTICGLKLSCSTTLNRHLSVHSDKMQHLCEHCGRAFKRDTTLKAHMILHTGLKPYSCKFCQLTFACSSNCRRHMRKAHSEEFTKFQPFGNNIKK